MVGASIARPPLPNPQPRKYTPAPLAGLPCRPLQAKGMACVKNIAISKFHRRGEHCSPAKALCCRKAPRVEQSPTPTINRKRMREIFIALSQFHRRGGAWLRPGVPNAGSCVSPRSPHRTPPPSPHPQPRKYAPAPLAGLQCRPLQAKDSALHKNTPALSII